MFKSYSSPEGGKINFKFETPEKIEKRTINVCKCYFLNDNNSYDLFITGDERQSFEQAGKKFMAPCSNKIKNFYSPVSKELLGPVELSYSFSVIDESCSVVIDIEQCFGDAVISCKGLSELENILGFKIDRDLEACDVIRYTGKDKYYFDNDELFEEVCPVKFKSLTSGNSETMELLLDSPLFEKLYGDAKKAWITTRNNIIPKK